MKFHELAIGDRFIHDGHDLHKVKKVLEDNTPDGENDAMFGLNAIDKGGRLHFIGHHEEVTPIGYLTVTELKENDIFILWPDVSTSETTVGEKPTRIITWANGKGVAFNELQPNNPIKLKLSPDQRVIRVC